MFERSKEASVPQQGEYSRDEVRELMVGGGAGRGGGHHNMQDLTGH